MTQETASVVFFAVASVMWAVWLVATRFALARVRRPRPEAGGPDVGPYSAEDMVTGEAVIDGDAEAISKKIAEQIVSAASAGGAAGIRIVERTRERVAFERIPGAMGGPVSQALDSGVVVFEEEGGRVRARYAVSTRRFSRIMRIVTYAVCFGYGGLIVVIVPLIIWLKVVDHPDEAVRWQVFQTFQMVHGVWPPFLVGVVAGKVRRAAVAFFDALLANVAYIA